MAHLNYNANEHEEMRDMTPLPKGKYNAIIEATKLGEAKGDKYTQQLEITWVVVGGEHEGRKVTNWVTVACDTAVARDIGMRFLRNVCEAVGLAGFTDTDELCGRQHVIDVGTVKKERDGKAEEYGEVKRCYPTGVAPACGQSARAFSGAEPAAGVPAEKSKCALPACAPHDEGRDGRASTTNGQSAQGAVLPPWARK